LLQALHDVGHGADRKNFVGTRLIDAGVVLRGEENLAIARQRFFERADAGFTGWASSGGGVYPIFLWK